MRYTVLLAAAIAVLSASADQITVWRQGRDAWIQSRFSQTQDIVIGIWKNANEKAYLIPRGGDIRRAAKGLCLHMNSDEYPATAFNSYGFLSGNHGSAAARLVTAHDHGFTAADVGKIITDEKKRSYVLVQVQSADKFIMHPEPANPKAPLGRAVFPRHSKEKLFFNDREIKFTSSAMVQLRPLNRVSRNEFLIDGKTLLPDDTVVRCNFLDHVFEHDVVVPEAFIRFIREKAGEKIVPAPTSANIMFYPADEPGSEDYMKLPALMTVRNRLRYEDNGAMVNYRQCTYPLRLTGVSQLEVMFGWHGAIAKGAYQKFYIPKTRPMTFPGRKDKTLKYSLDFVKGVDIAKKRDLNSSLSPDNVDDPADPPDRFIRVTGKSAPEYGIAVGYSLISGHTALTGKGRDRKRYYHLWYTQKMYPYAYALCNNEPGTTIDTVSYKQYFCPAEEPDLTAFYFHRQGKSLVVYAQTYKPLDGKQLNLPQETEGQKITVVEKTPSVTLLTPGKIPPGGVKISSTGNYGYIVLKLDK